jgi:hypothetical protein
LDPNHKDDDGAFFFADELASEKRDYDVNIDHLDFTVDMTMVVEEPAPPVCPPPGLPPGFAEVDPAAADGEKAQGGEDGGGAAAAADDDGAGEEGKDEAKEQPLALEPEQKYTVTVEGNITKLSVGKAVSLKLVAPGLALPEDASLYTKELEAVGPFHFTIDLEPPPRAEQDEYWGNFKHRDGKRARPL